MNHSLDDRYELGEELGTGGVARVLEAYDRTLNRRVAVKLLRDDVGAELRSGSTFLTEARAAASFSHPNAVQVYDFGREGGRSFIVMERIDGCSLAVLLRERGAIGVEESVAVARQVLAALGAAHARDLVHRDVKPGNILLPGCRLPWSADEAGAVKLTDFGIARSLREAPAEGPLLGTPTYLSPEQVARGVVGPAADVYAVGVVLYEMLAGSPPFGGASASDLAAAHRSDLHRDLREVRGDVPARLAAVVDRALEKDPEARWPDARAMGDALADVNLSAATPLLSASLDDDAPAEPMPVDGPPPSRLDSASPVRTVALVAAALLLALFAWQAVSTAIGDAGGGDAAATAAPSPSPPAPEESVEPEAPVEPETPVEPEEPEEPAPESPDDGAGVVGDLLDRVSGPIGLVGERGADLRDALRELQDAPAAAQPEEARDLIEEVRRWVEDGELPSAIGSLVTRALEEIAGP